jgi:glucarate dehydratase
VRITDLKVTPVAIPDPPLRNSWGIHEPYFTRCIVQLFTDEGLVGLGETSGGGAIASALQAAKSHVIGMDPYSIEVLRLALRNPVLFAPLEEACLDLMGKHAGKRVCEILGGPVRERVPYAAYLFYKEGADDQWGEVLDPASMVREAEQFVERWGFKSLKVKGGVLHPDLEVETMLQMRERFPGFQLRIDPNAIWSVETSKRVAYKLRDIDLEYLEDPCADIAGMALVAASTAIPLATNMCVVAWEHIPHAVQAKAVDVILADHHIWGGLVASVQLGRLCSTFGWGFGQHSNSHLGITMAAMTHLAAAVPNLIYASDSHYPWIEEDIIAGPMFTFEDGFQQVPSGPGLGVELDEDKLDKYAELYRSRPAHARDDVAEMRKRDPSWVPLKPRW